MNYSHLQMPNWSNILKTNETMLQKAKKKFPFLKNDVVLARYGSELYYAKILTINYKRKLAKLLFDDDSKEEVSFKKIFSVNEETSDIICIICKKDTDIDNDIVLCDSCNVGYHQLCHDPVITSDVLLPEVPWQCVYCEKNETNPHVSDNPFDEKEGSTSGDHLSDHDDNSESDVQQGTCLETYHTTTQFEATQINDKNFKISSEDFKKHHHEDADEFKKCDRHEMEICEEKDTNINDCKNDTMLDENNNNRVSEGLEEYVDNHVVIAHADSTSNDDNHIVNHDSNISSSIQNILPSPPPTKINKQQNIHHKRDNKRDNKTIDEIFNDNKNNNNINHGGNFKLISQYDNKNTEKNIQHLSDPSDSHKLYQQPECINTDEVDVVEMEKLENKMKLQRLDSYNSCGDSRAISNSSRNHNHYQATKSETTTHDDQYWIRNDQINKVFKEARSIHDTLQLNDFTKRTVYAEKDDPSEHFIKSSRILKDSSSEQPYCYMVNKNFKHQNENILNVNEPRPVNYAHRHSPITSTRDISFDHQTQEKPNHVFVQKRLLSSFEGVRYEKQSDITQNYSRPEGDYQRKEIRRQFIEENRCIPQHNQSVYRREPSTHTSRCIDDLPRNSRIISSKNIAVSPRYSVTLNPRHSPAKTPEHEQRKLNVDHKIVAKSIYPSPRPNSVQLEKRAEVERQLNLQRQWIEEHDTQRQLHEHAGGNGERITIPNGMKDRTIYRRIEKTNVRNMQMIREEYERRPGEFFIKTEVDSGRRSHKISKNEGKALKEGYLSRTHDEQHKEIHLERSSSASSPRGTTNTRKVYEVNRQFMNRRLSSTQSLSPPVGEINYRLGPSNPKEFHDPYAIASVEKASVYNQRRIHGNSQQQKRDTTTKKIMVTPPPNIKYTATDKHSEESGHFKFFRKEEERSPGQLQQQQQQQQFAGNRFGKTFYTERESHSRSRLYSDSTAYNGDFFKKSIGLPLKRTASEPLNRSATNKKPRTLPTVLTTEKQYNQKPMQIPPSEHRRQSKTTQSKKSDVFINAARNEVLHQEKSSEQTKSSTKKRSCGGCGGDAHFLCSGCRNIWYCTQNCQFYDWEKHVSKCGKNSVLSVDH